VQAGAHDGLHHGPVEDDNQLIGQALGILGAATLGLAGEVVARDAPGRMTGVGQLGGGVDEGAAAELIRRRPSAKAVEDRQDLLAGRASSPAAGMYMPRMSSPWASRLWATS